MNPNLKFRNLDLAQIDFDDFSYSISPEREIVLDNKLNASISRHGILHPPVVREINSDTYNIVAGRKRLLSFRSRQTENTCTCLIISRQLPEVDVFSILLEEIQLSREVTIIEKAIFLQKMRAITDEKQIIGEFLPRLGLEPDSFSLKKNLKLLDLEDQILLAIHQGQITGSVAHDFILLSPQDRMTLLKIIKSLRLSVSFQKKLLHMCRELASRDNTSITSLLDNDEMHGILHHQDANPPQKTKNLMLWLSRKLMPRSSQAAEEFKRFITAMQLPQNVSIEHTPFFEDDSIILSISYPNRKSLQNAWKKIRDAIQNNGN